MGTGVVLKHETKPALVGGNPVEGLAIPGQGTGFLGLQTGDDPEQRGLAAPARSQYGEDLTIGNGQGDALEGDFVAETDGEVDYFKHDGPLPAGWWFPLELAHFPDAEPFDGQDGDSGQTHEDRAQCHGLAEVGGPGPAQ